jgi:hypothetical protein
MRPIRFVTAKAPPPSGLASAAPFGEFRELRTYLRMELHIYLRSSDGRAAKKQVLRLRCAPLLMNRILVAEDLLYSARRQKDG